MNQLSRDDLLRMARSAWAALERERNRIDGLNVFPVPDGDTGVNMAMTLGAAVRRAEEAGGGSVLDALAEGALRGARGNSGTILSQFFAGFARGAAGRDILDVSALVAAMSSAAEAAYRAVLEPKEGTMLTVGRAAAEAADAAFKEGKSLPAVVQAALEAAEAELERSPERLDVLKEAGVVDAGGEGLVVAMRAALAALNGEVPDLPPEEPRSAAGTQAAVLSARHAGHVIRPSEITFTYCTEFLISGTGLDLDELRSSLLPLGDSLLVVGDSGLVKVHLHTDHPGRALEIGCELGEISGVSVANMKEQNRIASRASADPEAAARMPARPRVKAVSSNGAPGRKVSAVAVGMGAGFARIYESLGVDAVVNAFGNGKPSVGELVDGLERAQAPSVVVLPCHPDVELPLRQAATLTTKKVSIVPALTPPHGVAALMRFDGEMDAEANARTMAESLDTLRVLCVGRAARTAEMQGVRAEEGDYVVLEQGVLKFAGPLDDALVAAVSAASPEPGALITLYWGAEVDERSAKRHAERLRTVFGSCEVEVYEGGQPALAYWLSVE